MSAKELQEMENPVTRGAKAAESMPKLSEPTATGLASVEDLGGPTPENYKPDNDSAKLKPAAVKTVKDIVNRGAKGADAMQSVGEEIEEEEVISELLDKPMKKAHKTSSGQQRYTTGDGKTTGPAGAALYGAARKVLGKEEVETDEELIDENPEYDIEEDLAALFGGEELSEEFQLKAKTIFEAAVTAKVNEVQEELAKEYEATLSENLEAVKQELVERVDAYLEYVSDEWLKENALEVEHGLKTEMTESFLSGMKGLFEDHYVHIPEDKYNVLESMVSKLDEMENRLNEQIEKNISLNKRLGESTADGIFREVAEGLAQTQKEKLYSLAEGVEFEGEDAYREKLVTLKESYFPSNKAAQTSNKAETLSEGLSNEGIDVTNSMASYLKALGMGK
jgi:hypothetical protein